MWMFDSQIHWDKAPFWLGIFTIGFGFSFSWFISKGIFNLFNKKRFIYKMYWLKIMVVLFCIIFAGALVLEITHMVPRTGGSEYDDEIYLGPFTYVIFGIVAIIGWTLWRHVERYNRHWRCESCGTINSAWLDECGNPSCKAERPKKPKF
jgi:hypothetical protein